MNSTSIFTPTTPLHTGSSTPSNFSSTTNTAWATPAASYPTSAMSEESSVARTQRNYGQNIRSPPAAATSRTKPGVLNIPSPGAVTAAKVAANNSHHGSLHKRSASASSLTTPRTAAFPPFDPNYPALISPPTLYGHVHGPPSPTTSIRHKVKIKPLLSKLQSKEKTSLDLSRTAAENEGLGIYTSNTVRDGRGGSDASGGRRVYHTRTTSGTSQISTTTTSSTHRSGAQYVHPMRQTPRPFTPPPAHSHESSYASELSSINTTDEAQSSHPRSHRSPYNSTSSSSYAPLPTLKRIPPPLHIRTHSSSRLTSSSQTNLPGTPSSLRYADTFSTPDPMPLTSRSSIDSAFRKRSRANTATDPVAQLAAVQALRAEFNAREAAKDLKIQQAEARLQQKDARRRERRDESARRKSEAQERRRARSLVASEKSVPLSMEYSQTATVPMDIDLEASESVKRPKQGRTATAGSATKAVGSQWSLFWFRFKTMWLKLKRSMSRGS